MNLQTVILSELGRPHPPARWWENWLLIGVILLAFLLLGLVEYAFGRLLSRLFRGGLRKLTSEYRRANRLDD